MGCCHSYFKLEDDQSNGFSETRMESILPRVDSSNNTPLSLSATNVTTTKQAKNETATIGRSNQTSEQSKSDESTPGYTGYIAKSKTTTKISSESTKKRDLVVNLPREELRDVLKPLDFSSLVQEKSNQYLSGTRMWIFKDAMTWMDDAEGNRVFWLAGSGGTVKLL